MLCYLIVAASFFVHNDAKEGALLINSLYLFSPYAIDDSTGDFIGHNVYHIRLLGIEKSY